MRNSPIGRRRRGRWLAAGLILAGCGLLTACSAQAPPPTPSAGFGVVQDRAVPSFPLISDNGNLTSLHALRGKDIVLAPFLTLCQDECPLVTGAFIALQRDVAAAGLTHKVVFLEVSVDPWRDTPARLRAYSREFGADWPLLTGSKAQLKKFWSFFYVYFQRVPEASPPKKDWLTGKPLTFDVNHTDGFILIDATGHERFITTLPPNLKGKLSSKLTSLLNSGGLENLHHQKPDSWTLPQAVSALGWLLGTNLPQVART